MQIIRELTALKPAVAGLRGSGDTLALVPTMGALHDGHLALVAEARAHADHVAATIFVNPLQFNDPKDLARYPRTEEADLAKLEAAGCDLVWMPTPDQLYPPGFATSISMRGVSDRWEGEHRPGHFDGVATVVAKLLLAVRPTHAIFGEKDWQQLAVIRRVESDLGIGVTILGHPTVREADGLAMSSRNALLSADHRGQALALSRALNEAATEIAAGRPIAAALERATAALRAGGFSGVDYIALVDADSLEPLESAREPMRLLAAASLGGVRLIDNIPVTLEQQVGW
ncbi:pantoate--beta-alanine ligase [Sphingomonas glaciei]|uniref:Pantothenate synthetase n=1 Tax=Sphingomonas glaciei TaxID=2938948 RepID=A0ABY5MV65_9SPHN|nr:pantoate--beta-alanine ligase [Sphingomonas glaciei]UUR07008.1 pantoate--beta-alanine ligase [Sphingomonas glaciei]